MPAQLEAASPESPVTTQSGFARIASGAASVYVLTAILSFVLSALFLQPWSAAGKILGSSGDALFQQAMTQAAGRVGLFTVDPNLGWPGGTGFWSVPQLGLLLGMAAWISISQLGLEPAPAVLWLVALSGCVNAVACLYFLRAFRAGRAVALPIALAVAVGASPFFIAHPGHLNVAPWFVVPIAMGVAVRFDGRLDRRLFLHCGLLLVAAILSPLWWLICAALIVVVLGLCRLLVGRFREALILTFSVLALGCGVLVQSGFMKLVPQIDPTDGRGPWDSNIYGGRLVDLFFASPTLNGWFRPTQELAEGASAELKPLGLVAGCLAVVALGVLLTSWGSARILNPLDKRRLITLSQLTVIATLAFLAGGLGNLQAGFAVLAGSGSSARTWSRFLIVVALIGAAWLLVVLRRVLGRWRRSHPQERPGQVRLAAIFAAILVLGVWFFDSRPALVKEEASKNSLSEWEAVSYLSSRGQKCPVLQLPVTNGLGYLPRHLMDANHYRGYVPYLINPDIPWSYGSVSPEQLTRLRSIPSTLTRTSVGALSSTGYCAVLFDKAVAAADSAVGGALPGRNVDVLGSPEYESRRFNVYRLPGGR